MSDRFESKLPLHALSGPPANLEPTADIGAGPKLTAVSRPVAPHRSPFGQTTLLYLPMKFLSKSINPAPPSPYIGQESAHRQVVRSWFGVRFQKFLTNLQLAAKRCTSAPNPVRHRLGFCPPCMNPSEIPSPFFSLGHRGGTLPSPHNRQVPGSSPGRPPFLINFNDL